MQSICWMLNYISFCCIEDLLLTINIKKTSISYFNPKKKKNWEKKINFIKLFEPNKKYLSIKTSSFNKLF